MTPFRRYWLLHIPGSAVLGALLAGAHHWLGLSLPWALAVFAGWLVKDLAFFPLLRKHYVFREQDPKDSLVGRRAVAEERLSPRGYVRLGNELWLAEVADENVLVAVGEEVTVEAVEGLTLRVRGRTH